MDWPNPTRAIPGTLQIEDTKLQTAILRTAHDPSGADITVSVWDLCADIVAAERRTGHEPSPETLLLHPQDWRALGERFLKSLDSDAERSWIERLALTPLFDEAAARRVYSQERSAAQDAAWDALPGYSFIDPVAGRTGWFTVRAQMRWALEEPTGSSGPDGTQSPTLARAMGPGVCRHRSTKSSVGLVSRLLSGATEGLRRWNELAEAARMAIPPKCGSTSNCCAGGNLSICWATEIDLR